MKHLKQFENTNTKKFWVIPTHQPHLLFALKSIGMNNTKANLYFSLFYNDKKYDTILIFKEDKEDWSWSTYNSSDSNNLKYISNPDYINMGTIYITEEQLAANKYNL